MLDKLISKIQIFSIFGILLLVPLVFYPKALVSFETPKVFLFRIFIGILLISVIIEFFFLKSRFQNFIKIFVDKKFLFIPILILLSSTISTLLSDCPYVSFYGSENRHFGLISIIYYIITFYLFIYILTKREIRKTTIYIVSASLISVMLIGFLQYLNLVPWLRAKVAFENIRVFSTIGQPNVLAGFLILIIPVLLLYEFKKYRYIIFILFLLWSVVLILSLSRIGIFISIFEILLFSYLLMKKNKYINYILMSILLCLSSSILLTKNLFLRFMNLDTLHVRFLIFKGAILAFLKKPIFGYGFDNFQNISAKFINPAISKYEFSKRIVDRVHNFILDCLINGGVFYVGLLIIFIIFIVKYLRDKKLDDKKFAIIIALISFFLFLSFNFSTIVLDIFVIFWVAYLLSDETQKMISIYKNSGVLITSISIILVLYLTFISSFPILMSDILIKKYFVSGDIDYLKDSISINKTRASQYLLLAYNDIDNIVDGQSIREINKIYFSARSNLEIFLHYSGNYEKYYLALAEISIKKNIYLNDNFNDTYMYFQKALEYNPYNPEIHGKFGITLFLNNRIKDAKIEFNQFYKLIPSDKKLLLLEDSSIINMKQLIDKLRKS